MERVQSSALARPLFQEPIVILFCTPSSLYQVISRSLREESQFLSSNLFLEYDLASLFFFALDAL